MTKLIQISKFIPFLNIGDGIIALLLLIDAKVYSFVSKLYGLFIDLAKAEIFNNDFYQDISSKIYLVIGVLALFVISYALIQNIINPDNLKNSGKNGAAIIKKIVICFLMIVLTPSIFNFLYSVQDAVLSDNIIPKVLLGESQEKDELVYYSYINEDGDTQYIFTDDCTASSYEEALKNCEKVSTTLDYDYTESTMKTYGNEIGLIVLNAFLYPSDGVADSEIIENASDFFDTETNLSIIGLACAIPGAIATLVVVGLEIYTSPATGFATLAAIPGTIASFGGTIAAVCGIGAAAGAAVTGLGYAITYDEYSFQNAKDEIIAYGAFDRITVFADAVNNGEMEYMPIISTICGLLLVYILLSYCLDLGLRAAKLAFYQLFAPISMLLNIVPGQKDLFKNWVNAVVTTWLEVFIRIFTLCSVAYLISNLNNNVLNELGLLPKAIVVMGLVMFAKQFPKLLGDLTGIKSENMKLGIMEKLGAGGALAATALVGGGLNAGIKNTYNTWKTNRNQGKGKLVSAVNATRSGLAGFVSGGVRSAKNAGLKAKSVDDLSKAVTKGAKAAHNKSQERIAYKSSHGGTLKGVAVGHAEDAITSFTNFIGSTNTILDIVDYENDYLSAFDDYSAIYENGTYKAMVSQLSSLEARRVAEGGTTETFAGSGITIDDAIDKLEKQMRFSRLDAINKNVDSTAYVAYNLARQVKKDQKMAARAGVSADFISNVDDFVLRNNVVYHKDGVTKWTAAELHKLFEASQVTGVDSKGKVVSDATDHMYGTFDGLFKTKGKVKTQRTKDKNSIGYKEAKKAKDSSKS